MTEEKKRCTLCVLHSKVPGVAFTDEGLCSVCVNFKKFKPHEPQVKKYLLEEMENLFKTVKKANKLYDVLVLFSGGKDSTILLKIAREKYGLRTLAFSVIHPLVNSTASRNMEDVTKKLGVDLIKAYVDEEVYKKVIRHGILKGPEYGLGEFFGCDVCSFFHHWLPVRYAMKLDISIILEGSDLSQTGEISFLQSARVKAEAKQGKKPYGRVHELVMDALGPDYKGSIYDYNPAEITEGNYPTIISPFSFLDYDYRDNFKEIAALGLSEKAFRSIYTNCAATPFFSYFSLKRFDCVSYIRHYATEVRRGYPNLMQRSLDDSTTGEVLNRDVVDSLMDEFKNVVLYIAKNKLTETSITGTEKEKLMRMTPMYLKIFGEGVCDVFLHDVLQIPFYADYFGVDLDQF